LYTPISISGISSISALGISSLAVWQHYLIGKPLFSKKEFKNSNHKDEFVWVSQLVVEAEKEIKKLYVSNPHYKRLDRSVLFAIIAAKNAFLNHKNSNKNIGVNIGSSRGATELFESYYKEFLTGKKISAFTSPTTTLGNISSWVGQEIGVNGIRIGHSVTCSTALHAMLNGIAWLEADMADAFVVGGSEAALTPFTLAQMQSLKLYTTLDNHAACESMRFQKKKNTMVLGEGAAVAVLEKGISENTQAIICGYGYASEKIEHNSSISENAECFQKSMKMALQKANLKTVDAVIMHAPGTVKGDMAEYNAINEVFNDTLPLLTSNKWLVGHTFAASGMLSIEMGILMLKNNKFIENPFFSNQRHLPKELKTVLVNAVGFGGNAVSIIISKP